MDMENLSIEDCMCSICMCIYVEPVTMPCTHTLCMPCFKQNVEATSLTCPLCRKRISTWARRAAKDNTLINHELWSRIQSLFPDKVEKRLEGEDQDDDESMDVFHPIINIAQPGEIRQEYEEQLKRLEKERELERLKEQEASIALIRKLEREKEVKSVDQQLIEEKDEELARELDHIANEAGTDSPFNLLLKESKNRLTRSRGSSSNNSAKSPLTIQSFLSKMREAEKLKLADRSAASGGSPYPYACFTPSDKDHYSRPSTLTISSSRSTTKSSTSCTSYNTEADVEWEVVTHDEEMSAKPGNSHPKVGGAPSSTVVRSNSSQSMDSINQELNHFKPIKSCPVTPPKRNESGKVVEAQVIRTTPRNLSESFSPSRAKSLSEIDAGSPVMRRRLSELDQERKSLVRQNSKSTETSNDNEEKKNDISKYFAKKPKCMSPSENIPSLDTNHENSSVTLKKVIIPLEPIFDNVDGVRDFEDIMAPLMEINNIQNRTTSDNKSLKSRKRNLSRQENISNNAICSPQRSITEWLSGTSSPKNTIPDTYKNPYVNLNKNNSNCGDDMEIDSKEGILDSGNGIGAGTSRNKLKLKKYPKRKHEAYHISDYVYPNLSPKKRKICIELSSDEEDDTQSDKDSVECLPIATRKPHTCKTVPMVKKSRVSRSTKTSSKQREVKKLRSVKQSKHKEKRVKTTCMQNFLQPSSGKSHSRKDNLLTEAGNESSASLMSEKEIQEEADRKLALELEKLFQYEEKNKLDAIRMKGSNNEYNFRNKKSRVSTSEELHV